MVTIAMIQSGVAGCGRPQGVLFPAIDPPRVWPPTPDVPRIKLVGVLSASTDLRAEQSGLERLKSAFRGPRPPIRFSSPHGVAFGEPQTVAVADGAAGAVHLIDLELRSHRLVTGFGEARFASPLGVTWANERLFITDAQRGEIVELDRQGAYQRCFGQGELARPVGITYVPSRGSLYAVDGGSHRIVVFELSGRVARAIGSHGSGPGEFNFPTHIASRGDTLLVSDSGNFRVQMLDLDGAWIASIGQKGDGAGDLSLPKGVAFDSDGHIYVIDAHFENVQIFDTHGRLLMAFGEEGGGPGTFSLPAGLAIDGRNRIWVADSGNRRLQVFQYLGNSS